MSIEVRPYFAEGEMYPALIGVRAEGDEYETAYVSKSELVDALADNAKLRELVLELWTYAEQELLCDENCPYGAVCDWRDCVFEQRMRELEVEVKG